MAVSAGVTSNVTSGNYTTAQEVTLTTTEAEGTIYYTLDGTAPTSESTEYTEPIELATGTMSTIKAVTVTEGKDNSEVLTLYIVIQSAILDEIKAWIGITHDKRDADILGSINYAKKELERAGIKNDKIVESDSQIKEAIKVYSKYAFASDEKIKAGFFESWQYQLDCIRKTAAYAYNKITFTVKTGETAIEEAAITIGETILNTNSLGVAYYRTKETEIDIDYTVSKSGYTTVTGSVYVDGDESVNVAMEAEA